MPQHCGVVIHHRPQPGGTYQTLPRQVVPGEDSSEEHAEQALDEVTRLLRDVSAWRVKYGVEPDAFTSDANVNGFNSIPSAL